MEYVIIGNGVAGTTAAAAIRNNDPSGTIRMITDEAQPFYSRIRLMEYLSGEVEPTNLQIKKDAWYAENKIELVLNDRGQITHSSADDQRARITLQQIDPRFFFPKIPESIGDPARAAASHLVPTIHFP